MGRYHRKKRGQRVRVKANTRLAQIQVHARAGVRHRRLHRSTRESQRVRSTVARLLPKREAGVCRQGRDRVRPGAAAASGREARTVWLIGEGLQFANVVALTLWFGLGLSATIHFLNRLRQEERPDRDPAIAVERATVLVGPPLILTSVVLACGLIVTVFSDLPSLRLFGWLSAFAMLAALAADLLILRPTVTFLSRL